MLGKGETGVRTIPGKIFPNNTPKAPADSGIPNVFAMHEPQHMLSKLLWEIDVLTKSMSVWVDNEQFPVPIFVVFQRCSDSLAHYRLALAIKC